MLSQILEIRQQRLETCEEPIFTCPPFKLRSVSQLILENINLREEEVKTIASSISNNCNIRVISLANNRLTAKSLSPIVLIYASRLKEIFLNNNRLGDEGMTVIKTFMRNNLTVSNIDVSENGVGDQGMAVFANAVLGIEDGQLVCPLNLKRPFPVLRVARNRFSSDGLKCCLKMCMLNTSIKHLDISGNLNLDSNLCLDILSQFFMINKTLETIDLKGTSLCINDVIRVVSERTISLKRLALGTTDFKKGVIYKQHTHDTNGKIQLISGSIRH